MEFMSEFALLLMSLLVLSCHINVTRAVGPSHCSTSHCMCRTEQPQFDGCIRTMTHHRTDASVDCGCIRSIAPTNTAPSLLAIVLRERENRSRRGCDAAEGESRRAGADSRARNNNANMSSLVHLLPASVCRGHLSCVQGARGRTRTRSGDD